MSSTILTMESLALPKELYWDGKIEPISPSSSELFSTCESSGNWLTEDNFANEIKYLIDDTFTLKPDEDLDISQELIDGDDIVVELYDIKELKEENWSDAKLQTLPTELLDYQIGLVTQPNAVTKVYSPYDVLPQSLSSTSFETTSFTQLTPPHSPPQSIVALSNQQQTLVSTKNINNVNELLQQPLPPVLSIHSHNNQHQTATTLPHESFSNWDNGNHTPATDDIARDVQIVDDIVNIRAKELVNWNDECESQSSSALSQAESIIDEEWFPECSSYSASVSSASSSPVRCSSGDGESKSARSVQPKKRTRAYGGRGIEDRKIRKKEQNKNAATRYRQKKKLEMESVLSEEQTLAVRNEELSKILADCNREEKYLKSLIREFYTHKKKK